MTALVVGLVIGGFAGWLLSELSARRRPPGVDALREARRERRDRRPW